MKLTKISALPSLEKGQLWKTEEGHVEIMEVGKILTHYRMLRDRKRAPTNLGIIEMVQKYLKSHGGRLVKKATLEKLRAAS